MLRRFLTIAIAVSALTFSAYAQAPAAAKKAASKAADTAGKGAATAKAATGLIDINSAKAEDLEVLPGIGKAYSKKIVDGRPYVNKSQLVSKGVLPQKVYDKVSSKIIAKQ